MGMIEAIRERLEKAGLKPWDTHTFERWRVDMWAYVVHKKDGELSQKEQDATDFLAHAPEDIDHLLQENERLSGILRKLCARHLTGINGYEGELCYVCLEVEGLEDGELKPEVVERLKQSAALPRESLLTPEQMQERLDRLEGERCPHQLENSA